MWLLKCLFMYLEAWFWEIERLEKEKRCCSASQQRTKSWQLSFKEKWGLHVLEECLDLCWLCGQSLPDWTCHLVFQSSPWELVLEICWIPCIPFCVGQWGPNIQISCLTLSLFAQCGSTWHELHGGDLNLCCPLGECFGREQLQATPPFAFLVKLDHGRSISLGIRECWRFLEERSGSGPWELYCEREGQTEGRVSKSYVILEKSRLRSCDNEIIIVQKSNHFLGSFFFVCFGFWFVVVCGDLFVCGFQFFSFILCKCLIKVQKGSLC